MKITLAIPKGKKYKKRLEQELALASNIKSKQTREQVERGLSNIISYYQDGKVFLFDGNVDQAWTCDYPLDEFIYFCGKYFVVPNISTGSNYMLVAMDANEATIGLLQGKSIKTLWSETSNVQGKHKDGGQSAARFQRARQEALKHWFKKVADKMKELHT